MKILKLANQSGITVTKKSNNDVSYEYLESFAQAVIEDYKASLVPVGTTYVSNSGYMEVELHKTVNEGVPLYTLGETK